MNRIMYYFEDFHLPNKSLLTTIAVLFISNNSMSSICAIGLITYTQDVPELNARNQRGNGGGQAE